MHKRNLIIILIIVIATTIFYNLENIGMINVEKIQIFIQEFGILAPIIFIILYILLILVGFSAGILTITAGIIFNPYLAFILVMIAAFTGATIAFFIGRRFENKFVKLKNTKHKNLKKILKKIEENALNHGFITIITLRIAFVPYIWLSYLSGIVKKMKYKDFILATFLTNFFGSFVYIFLGFSITQNLPLFIAALIILIIFNIILRIYHKKIHK